MVETGNGGRDHGKANCGESESYEASPTNLKTICYSVGSLDHMALSNPCRSIRG